MVVHAIAFLFLCTALAGPALADNNGGQNGGDNNGGQTGGNDNGGNNGGSNGADPPNVPEIDPSSAISGIALLTTGVLLLTDRKRVKK
jgi:hypothetical protein